MLSQRIARSEASVTGIAGQRGVGKSSLALRVLDSRKEQNKAFTHLVHAPTGYEPREFLISIFQSICESVAERVTDELRETESLEASGDAQRKRLVYITWALLAVPLIVAAAAMIAAYIWLTPDVALLYEEVMLDEALPVAILGGAFTSLSSLQCGLGGHIGVDSGVESGRWKAQTAPHVWSS